METGTHFVTIHTTFADVTNYTIATPDGIDAARQCMRENGIKSLPVYRSVGATAAGAINTGMHLRADVSGVLSQQPAARAPRKFVILNGEQYFLMSDREIAIAQDVMAEDGIKKAPIHSTDGLCDDLDVLYARQFVSLPYTKTYADDHSESTYAIVRARDIKHAIELVTCRGGGLIDDECWWSKAANGSGDSVERADASCFYMMWSCDCGASDCRGPEDGTGVAHNSKTETITFRFDDAATGPNRDFCVYLHNGRKPAVEYLET